MLIFQGWNKDVTEGKQWQEKTKLQQVNSMNTRKVDLDVLLKMKNVDTHADISIGKETNKSN